MAASPKDMNVVKGILLMMGKNLLLSETEFDDFQHYCSEKGFDLSYFSSKISGSREEMEQHQFDDPIVIKLIGHQGIPYTVPEWQQNEWRNHFLEIQEDFFKKRTRVA